MSDNETDVKPAGSGFRWRHRFTVLGVAVVVIAVVAVVFFVIKDADEPSSGDRGDRAAVEAVYNQFAKAVQSSDIASAGICADRSEPKGKLTQTTGMIGGIGTAGSTIRVNIASITVKGDAANVDGSLNTMGTNVPLPLELRKVDNAWCVWS
ncbi:hypothetical protein [Gordonia phthalatica]|uniref:DUF4878 domain-containing protein n=1 Tax=Gordonia phthalatica TaxID=1136941 RepID=A0A0N9NB41_9ACTN|nr:hypothetical protein [Gordonia phthalatica]ALG85618.1 hypothetical protein ACH46_15450 [Gordonia phthalatica]